MPNDQPDQPGLGQSWTRRARWRPPRRTARSGPCRTCPRGAARGRRAAGVEPQHRDVGEGGQPAGRLAEDVAVHGAAVRGQRVEGHQRRAGSRSSGQRQLADERQAVGGVQLDVLAAGRQDGPGARLHKGVVPTRAVSLGSRRHFQDPRGGPRSAPPAGGVPVPALVRPPTLSAGQTTTWGTPGGVVGAAGAGVGTGRSGAGDGADDPLAAGYCSRPRRCRGRGPGSAAHRHGGGTLARGMVDS